jgi:CubicO group peptidase (beta-lactamase class C family)
VAEFGKPKPVDSTTLFLAGSISKPVFVSGLLQLLDQRKISLDTEANALLKSWKLPDSRFTQKEKVTLRRLVTHTAGLTVWGFPGYDLSKPVPTVPQLLDGTPPANTPAVRNDTFPGALWRYSGGGMTIAQLAATDISGEDFPALMNRLVLQPAGMKLSTYENPLPMNRRAGAASGHEQLDTPVPGGFHVYPEMAAAGLWTTASDLARWAIAVSKSYRGESGAIMPQAIAKQMLSRQAKVEPPFGNGWWGLGVTVGGEGDSLWFSHGGRDEGFVADLRMWPNLGKGYVLMMNGVNGLTAEVQRAFADVYGLGMTPRMPLTRNTRSVEDLRQYVGRYVGAQGADTVNFDVTVVGQSLISITNSTSKHSTPLVPVGPDLFVGLEGGSRWQFQRGADSTITGLAIGAGPNRRVLTRR